MNDDERELSFAIASVAFEHLPDQHDGPGTAPQE